MKKPLCNYAIAATLGMLSFNTLAEEVVNVYNWSDYIEESILDDFTKETGIKVVYDVFDSDEVLEAKLLTGNTGYDVVFPSATEMHRQLKANIFQALQKDKLPNLKHAWDFVVERVQAYDPGNVYSVNYMWGTTALGMNVEKIKALAPDAPLDSWEILYNPKYAEKIAKCGIYMYDAPQDMMASVLNYQGKDPNSRDVKELLSTIDVFKAIRPYIRKFTNSAYIDALANGDICLAVGHSGDILQARDRAEEAQNGVEVTYVIPKEGAMLWFDQMVIPADAPNVDNAHAFINYLLQPEVIAKSSNYVFYANGNKDAVDLMDKEVTEDKSIYPDAATLKKLYPVLNLSRRDERKLSRAWMEQVKANK